MILATNNICKIITIIINYFEKLYFAIVLHINPIIYPEHFNFFVTINQNSW